MARRERRVELPTPKNYVVDTRVIADSYHSLRRLAAKSDWARDRLRRFDVGESLTDVDVASIGVLEGEARNPGSDERAVPTFELDPPEARPKRRAVPGPPVVA